MKFFKGYLMLLSGGCLVLVVVATLFARSGTKTSSTVNQSVQSSSSISVGTSASVRGDRAIQIERSETVDSISAGNQFMEPVGSKGGKLIVVYMTLKNTGQESGNMSWTKFQLVDSQGRKYDEHFH